jgi:rhodanese-related sulfurtransferase
VEIKKISAKELYEKINMENKVHVLDVRAEEKFNEFHLQGKNFQTINVPKTLILNEELPETIPPGKEMIITCTTGNSAAKCAAILAGKEYNVLVLEGGLTAWKDFLKTL